jgi:hypothetical protein
MSQPATRTPWKMRRHELVEALEKMGQTANDGWTVPELRSLLIEMMDNPGHRLLIPINRLKLIDMEP